jgi:hypothetical protein
MDFIQTSVHSGYNLALVNDIVFILELSLSLQHNNSDHLLDVDPVKALLKNTPEMPIWIVKL